MLHTSVLATASPFSPSQDHITSEDLQRELQHENTALDDTLNRYTKALNKALDKKQGSQTLPARLLISRLTETFSEAIDDFVNPPEKPRGWNAGVKGHVRKIIKELGLTPQQLAFTTLKAALDNVYNPMSTYASIIDILQSISNVSGRLKCTRAGRIRMYHL